MNPGRHDGAEGNIWLVNLGLAEGARAGGCRWLEVTVRSVVYDLRLIECMELGGDDALDGWDGVLQQASVGFR